MSGYFINQKSQSPVQEFYHTPSDSFEMTDDSSTEERSSTFPFRSTPSGHLKVIPEQVVYESKRLSIVAADPKRTKVNFKSNEMSSTVQNLEIQSPGRGVFQVPQRHRCGGDSPRGTCTMTDHGRMMEVAPDRKETEQHIRQLQREITLEKMGFKKNSSIDWSKINIPSKPNLFQRLFERISNYRDPDILVKIGDSEFRCHLLVLQCYSLYFTEHPVSKIELPEQIVSQSAFIHIYDWMIHIGGNSHTVLRRDNVLDIIKAAQFLKIKELEEQCSLFVENQNLFSEDKAFMLYLDARAIGNTYVMELMVPRIQRFFLTLVASKDFLELVVEEVSVFLQSEKICINCEMEVFMSAVRWLMFDWEKRQKYLVELMSCVHFGLISPWQLVDIRRNPDNPEFLIVTSHPEVSCMIEDGLAYAIVKCWYSQNKSDYDHWIHVLGLNEPPPRNWAASDDINEQKKYSTYKEFLEDLSKYRKTQRLSNNRINGEKLDVSCESLLYDCDQRPTNHQ